MFLLYIKVVENIINVLKKIQKNSIAFWKNFLYTIICCDMIAMKREVAVNKQVFRGANVKLGN